MREHKTYTISQIRRFLAEKANPKKATRWVRYFRAEYYGLGDKFLGLTIPEVRAISTRINELPFSTLRLLINSRIHEERWLAVINLIIQFQKVQKNQAKDQEKLIFEFYMKEMLTGIDNWDLVDISADKIVGAYLIDRPQLKEHWLYKFLVPSSNLWHRRIAIVATQCFIKNNYFADTIRLAELFLSDKEELVHKATGWMLREMGKRQERLLLGFLEKHYKKMPRVMLRYSLEKFPLEVRAKYLKKGG